MLIGATDNAVGTTLTYLKWLDWDSFSKYHYQWQLKVFEFKAEKAPHVIKTFSAEFKVHAVFSQFYMRLTLQKNTACIPQKWYRCEHETKL